jgi:hypothetical protein
MPASFVGKGELLVFSCIQLVNGDLCNRALAIRQAGLIKHLGGAGKWWTVFDFYDQGRELTGVFWDKSGRPEDCHDKCR